MELINISPDLDQWFSNIVDTLNFDIDLINTAVGSLTTNLSTIDVSPIYVLTELVKEINSRLADLDARITALEG